MQFLGKFSLKTAKNFLTDYEIFLKFHTVFRKTSRNIYENLKQFLRKFHAVFMKYLHNFYENSAESLKNFHTILKKISGNL